MKIKISTLFISLFICTILGAIAMVVFKGRLKQVETDFNFNARILSKDNFFDIETAEYKGDILSKTIFSYSEEKRINNQSIISNVFDVRTPSGKPIFSVERKYIVDSKTGKHLKQKGIKNRYGYLFSPANNHKKPFYYWHINYDTAAYMQFSKEDTLYDLPVHVYTCTYQADQTNDLTYLPHVPEKHGITLDISLSLIHI